MPFPLSSLQKKPPWTMKASSQGESFQLRSSSIFLILQARRVLSSATGPILWVFSLYFLRLSFLTGPRVHQLGRGRLAGQRTPGIDLFPFPQHGHHRCTLAHPGFGTEAGDLNSGHYTCTAGTSPTESSSFALGKSLERSTFPSGHLWIYHRHKLLPISRPKEAQSPNYL